MKNTVNQLLIEIAQNPKIAAASSAATGGLGIATVLEKIRTDIGLIATIIGAILSVVLIFTHIRRDKREKERHRSEMELLELQKQKLTGTG